MPEFNETEALAKAIREVEEQTERDTRRAANMTKMKAQWQTPSPIYQAVLNAVRAKGRAANYHGDANESSGWAYIEVATLVPGKDKAGNFGGDYKVRVDIEEVMERTGWRSRGTGRAKLVVNPVNYGNSKRHFPERKDKTFNYEKVAEAIIETADEAARQAHIQRQSAIAASATAEFKERHGFKYGTVHAGAGYAEVEMKTTTDPSKPVQLAFKAWGGSMTLEQAEAFMALVKSSGLFNDKP